MKLSSYARHALVAVRLLVSLTLPGAPGVGAADVLTNAYDDARSGANLAESILSPANVRPGSFGRLFDYQVDGPVMGQPLVVSDVTFTGSGPRDVLYVTTGSNSVYAFDASGQQLAPLWRRDLTRFPDGRPAMPSGIGSTPVIDKATQTLYVVAGLNDGKRIGFVVHALDLRTGEDKHHGPALLQGRVTVAGQTIAFEPTSTRIAVQRAGLALAAGKVVIAFGGDFFEGWVFAVDATDLRKPADAFCTTCASRVPALSKVDYVGDECVFLGPAGGIWQSGRAPAIDADGHVYFFTSNKQHGVNRGCKVPPGRNACSACSNPGGCVCEGARSSAVCGAPDACIANQDADSGAFDLNESLIVLDPAAGLALRGWFRPDNWNIAGDDGLEPNDLDLGSSGPVLLPGTRRLIGGGKQGVVYVLDARPERPECVPSLATRCIAARPVQSFQIAPPPPPPNQYYRSLFGGVVLWNRGAERGGNRAYLWRVNDVLRSYAVSDHVEGCDTLQPAPTTSHGCESAASGSERLDQIPGGILTLSANAADPASGIVWASAYRAYRGAGRLMAFAAEPAATRPQELPLLWDSEMCQEDVLDAGSDFIPPTVAGGRVYLATAANRVAVFGLLEHKTCTAVPRVEGPGPLLQ
jgi:hypothetical protein